MVAWPEETSARLKELIEEGKTFSQAGEILGKTRNSVKSHANIKGYVSVRSKRNKLTAYESVLSSAPAKPQRRVELRQVAEGEYDPFAVPAGIDGVNTLDVTECRYILHEHPYVWCNKPRKVLPSGKRSPYCIVHSELCGRMYMRK